VSLFGWCVSSDSSHLPVTWSLCLAWKSFITSHYYPADQRDEDGDYWTVMMWFRLVWRATRLQSDNDYLSRVHLVCFWSPLKWPPCRHIVSQDFTVVYLIHLFISKRSLEEENDSRTLHHVVEKSSVDVFWSIPIAPLFVVFRYLFVVLQDIHTISNNGK